MPTFGHSTIFSCFGGGVLLDEDCLRIWYDDILGSSESVTGR